jgi:hypothetical protein
VDVGLKDKNLSAAHFEILAGFSRSYPCGPLLTHRLEWGFLKLSS